MSLDLTSAKFSLANARELALYARMAYDETPTIHDEKTDTNILIRDVGDAIVVACQGTKDLRNFITDAEVWRVNTPLGGVHYGFFTAFESVFSQLAKTLVLMQVGNPKPILPCGHSLGGSLATQISKALRDTFFPVHSAYLYGCPRTSDAKYQANYNATKMLNSPFSTLGEATFTLIHDCDLIPRMPGYLSGYRRPGHDEFLSPLLSTLDGQPCITEDPSVPIRLGSDIYSLVKGWIAKRGWTSLDQILTDHHIDNYIAALGAIKTEAA